MMKQYDEAKAACGDALLLFRMGDFYELFHDDARQAAQALSITLTSRDKSANPVPMAGFPHHQLESYLAKLIRLGFRVAVCEQVSDPKESKGLVRREIQRIVTAGTLTDEALLDPTQSNLLVALSPEIRSKKSRASRNAPERVGIAWVELSTGRFEAGVFARGSLSDELARLEPSEVLQREDMRWIEANDLDDWALTDRPAWQFGTDEVERVLKEHFGVRDLSGMGWNDSDAAGDAAAISAAGAALAYLQETQRSSLSHIRILQPARSESCLQIDSATRRSLELTHTIRTGGRDGALLGVIDHTVTAMGARRLAHWLASPLVDRVAIEDRHEAVQEIVGDENFRSNLRTSLAEVFDLERLLARIATGRCSPRDLQQVGRTLGQLPELHALLDLRVSQRISNLQSHIDLCSNLRERLDNALEESCPLVAKAGGFIRSGFNERLDAFRKLAVGGKQWIAEYQAAQGEATGIQHLKVGFNSVFGYYLEVTNSQKEKVPDSFVRKQTLKNAERYITAELKEYEEKVLTADDSAKQLEYEIFCELRDAVFEKTAVLQQIASVIAELDTLASLAELAVKRGYVRPVMVDEAILEIYEGRHPVLDATLASGKFVPNDSLIGSEHGCVHLITGPNMAGKSTYIRQTALLVILSQIGSFVPARKATIGIADQVFARVGASDELARGQSTFMVEMVETARILNTATERSLIILDEIGRGTSTYDGLSLAWSIVEYLHDKIRARTLFATHYHELIDLERSLPGVKNLNVSVKEWDDNVIFLHRIIEGGADKSYGIHVARLAGIPSSVNERAKDVLSQLEVDHLDRYGESKIATPTRDRNSPMQLTLFEWSEHPLLNKIRDLDVNDLSPMEALKMIDAWKTEIANDR
jgi:DNA mismatch repair protein MutS